MPITETKTKKKPHFKIGAINANQEFLKDWDDYQIDFLNSDDFNVEAINAHALLLPISVDIDDGIIKRHRIRAPQLDSLWDKAKALINDDMAWAHDSYMRFFKSLDGQQSATPPSPLDLDINSRVYMLFHLPRENWTFTEKVQFSVDNISKKRLPEAFEVVGTFDDGHGLIVHNKNWQHKGKKTFRAKYNLHVSIHQREDGEQMRTDIIIDPGTRNNNRP